VRKVPNEASFQFHLGMAFVQSGNWDKARVALKQALALKPDFDGAAEARKALGMIGT
jgi:Flp pilus assembly protein TadD